MAAQYNQLTEKELQDYCKSNGLEVSVLYCKDCGELLKYQGSDIHYQTRRGKSLPTDKGDIKHYGLTFLTTRDYNGTLYRLCRCRSCVEQKYPELKHVRCVYSQKSANYCKYAFDVNEDDFNAVCKKRQSVTLAKMVERYGEDDGNKRWNDYRRKQAYSNTFECKSKKFTMTKADFDEYNKSRAVTLTNLVKRHGIVRGNEIYGEYVERQRYTTSLEYFIDEYGPSVGLMKFKSFDASRMAFGGASSMADDCFDFIVNSLHLEHHEIYYHRLNREYSVKGYRLDFFDKTANIAIEFNGDIWHANPKMYSVNETIRMPSGDLVKSSDLWGKDEMKKDVIVRELNCKYVVIWQNDWKHCRDEIIERLIRLYQFI